MSSGSPELPALPPEEQAAFERDIAQVEAGHDITIGVETPFGRGVPINPNDMTPRQRVMMGFLAKALRERREAEERGEDPKKFW